jgi:hypothetical protein
MFGGSEFGILKSIGGGGGGNEFSILVTTQASGELFKHR